MAPLQIILIGLIVLVTVGMAVALVLMQRAEARKRAVSVIIGGAAGARTLARDRLSEKDKRRVELAKKLKQGDNSAAKAKKNTLADKLAQTGRNVTVTQFWIGSVVMGLVFTGGAWLMGMKPLAIFFVGITGFLGIPRFVVRFLSRRRQKKFLEEFADALESIVRLLKAGMPVTEAISMVSREYGGPVGEEMGRVYDAQKVGIPLYEAILGMAKRMPLTEVQMFATGIVIQQQTGASLSEVLLNLAALIRARFRLKRKVQALSSEAKASAMIIGSLPVAVATGLYFLNRKYIIVLFEDPFGNVLLGGAIFWMCLGILVMRQMINFRV